MVRISSFLYRQRARERGFNQVDLFGRPLTPLLRGPIVLCFYGDRGLVLEKHLLRVDERRCCSTWRFCNA